MAPYFAMMAVPALFALAAIRRSRSLLLLTAILFWWMIGWRFQVGRDWNNYLGIFTRDSQLDLWTLLTDVEPASGFVNWLVAQLGGRLILVNIIAAAIFCFGFFTVARRCREPFLAIVVAIPLLVVGNGMSALRQSMALGLIFYLFATWEKRTTLGRTIWVAFASLFHFSALFILAFVALASRFSLPVRAVAAIIFAAIIISVIQFAPGQFDFYTETYVSGPDIYVATGAIPHILPLTVAGVAYFAVRRRWIELNGVNPLLDYLAAASILVLPAVYFSSVIADRFALYFWSAGMMIYSGLPALIANPAGRNLYRLGVVAGFFVILLGWLSFANSSANWLPYRNVFWVSDEMPLRRPKV